MYAIFTNICPTDRPNVGKYTILYMEHMGKKRFFEYIYGL